jgi:hypothetical protein
MSRPAGRGDLVRIPDDVSTSPIIGKHRLPGEHSLKVALRRRYTREGRRERASVPTEITQSDDCERGEAEARLGDRPFLTLQRQITVSAFQGMAAELPPVS